MSHTDLRCACVTKHKPASREPDLHHVLPKTWGGPDTPENIVAICPNQHRLVHTLLREYRKADGTPPWSVRRHYSSFTRGLAARGWAEYEASR